MGTSIDAHCYSCGNDSFLRLGGGMRSYETYAAWPVSCNRCRAITTANFKESPLTCNQCGSRGVVAVSDPAIWKGGTDRILETWGELKLYDGEYKCPRCDEFALRFGTDTGGHGKMFWD
jgi:DNA-directed RNA polymerase subunit RPC12/RpoP